ncbi:MAG: flavoprotein [Treponema sp.]|nr:flavoprotein [Treponema sp.]
MSNILIYATASISCFKSCSLISALTKKGHSVKVIASRDALNFVGKASFEGLSKNPLLTDVFDYPESEGAISHITLSQNWTDVIVVYPASADTINKMAAGIADNLFGQVFLANNFVKPVLVAPAMNSNMFMHPATQESLKKLESWGCVILPCGEGHLACGTEGKGRLLEPEDALTYVEKYL